MDGSIIANLGRAPPRAPHLGGDGATKQLVVNGKPFLMLGAELQNSSATSSEYMDTVWQDLADAHINTVLGCVTWEMIEPVEDQFDFSELDKVLQGAIDHGLHMVLLWFGSFKNGTWMCLHLPCLLSSINRVEAACVVAIRTHSHYYPRQVHLRPVLDQDKSETLPASEAS